MLAARFYGTLAIALTLALWRAFVCSRAMPKQNPMRGDDMTMRQFRIVALAATFLTGTAVAAYAQSGSGTGGGSKSGSSSTMGTGGSTAGKAQSSSSMGTGGSSPRTTGLNNADQK